LFDGEDNAVPVQLRQYSFLEPQKSNREKKVEMVRVCQRDSGMRDLSGADGSEHDFRRVTGRDHFS
jgi:hypothetical protein